MDQPLDAASGNAKEMDAEQGVPFTALTLMALVCPWVAALAGWSNKRWTLLHQGLCFFYALGVFSLMWDTVDFTLLIPPKDLWLSLDWFYRITFSGVFVGTAYGSLKLFKSKNKVLKWIGTYCALNALTAFIGVFNYAIAGLIVIYFVLPWPLLVAACVLYRLVKPKNPWRQEVLPASWAAPAALLILCLGAWALNYPLDNSDNLMFSKDQGWQQPSRD